MIVKEKLITARGVYGLFRANAVGDDVELYTDETRGEVVQEFHFLRQQAGREGSEPCRSLSDFIAPTGTEVQGTKLRDPIGAFAVTAGIGVHEMCDRFRKNNDDYNAIMTEALADRLAEAFAECLHKHVREEWGYGQLETLSADEMIHEKYRGIRPAPGYPACPDHTEKGTIWRLLDVEAEDGDEDYRELRDVAWVQRERTLLRASEGALLQPGEDWQRPGGGLRGTQRMECGRSGAVAGPEPELRQRVECSG